MPTTEAPARVSAVPRRLRLVCALAAAAVVVGMVVVGLLLPDSSTGVVQFGWADQVAVIGIGICLGIGILTLGRSRVDADAAGVRGPQRVRPARAAVGRGAGGALRPASSSWASLLLTNGDEVSLLAVQAVDREHTVRAVEGLRALLAAARAAEEAAAPPRPPLLYDD